MSLLQALLTPVIALLTLSICSGLQIAALRHIDISLSEPVTRESAQFAQKQERALLKSLSRFPHVGFDNIVADIAFLRFIQYFGDRQARQQSGYTLSPQFFEIIIDQDARFIPAYSYLSTSISLFAGRPEKTVALMNKGLKALTPYMPNSYYVWVYKGTDELLFLGDSQAAAQSNLMAIKWAEIQNTPDSLRIADLSRQSVNFLASNPDSKRAQVSAWSMVLGSARDNQTRQYVIEKIKALGGQLQQNSQGQYQIIYPEED
jgi:hypothetical protein